MKGKCHDKKCDFCVHAHLNIIYVKQTSEDIKTAR